MFELWKVRHTFMDDVNIITKLIIAVLLFFCVIFVHQFDLMLYLAIFMLIFLLICNGVRLYITLIFVMFTLFFSLISALFMIFYGDGTHVLFKFGFIQISSESLIRGLHLMLRTLTVSLFGILIAFTSQIVMIFYSLMQHLKVKPKVAYAFMAAFRMVPLMISSLIQLQRSLKMRYQMIPAKNYRGINRIKHLLIPLLSQNIRKAHQLSVAMEKKGFRILCIVLAMLGAHFFPITGIHDVRISNIY